MTNSAPKLQPPSYIKYFFILSSIVLTGYALILAKPIFNPLLAAFIVALILKPLCSTIERFKIPRGLSTLFSIILVLLVMAAISTFFSSQVGNISSEMISIGEKLNQVMDKLQSWVKDQLGISPDQQVLYMKNSLGNILKNSTSFLTGTLSATAGFFTAFFLFLISLFFFLYYRSFLVSFLYKLFHKHNHHLLKVTLNKIEGVVRSYILGLLLVVCIIATLNTIGLFALGIEHALFFGLLVAILTIIPYIGIIIGSLLPILFAIVTTDSWWYPLGVIIIFSSVQFLEGNFITPNIIGNQVSINPFAAILGLLLGGMVLGLPGVIFAIPILAMVKVICDSNDHLSPIGYLIGNPPKPKKKISLKK